MVKMDGKNAREILEPLKAVPPRSPENAARGRAMFIRQATQLRSSVSKYGNVRHKGWILEKTWLARYFRKELSPMTTALVSALLAIVLALGSTSVTVAAAQESNANDLLYPVKLLSEDVRLWLSMNEATDLQLELQFLERRTSELNYLVSSGEPVTDGYLFRLHNEVNSILKKALQSPPDEVLQLMERVREQLMAQSQLMAQMKRGSDDALLQQSQAMLKQQTRFVENALESPVMNQEQLQQQLQEQIATQEGIIDQTREQIMQQTQLQHTLESAPAGEQVTPAQTGPGPESSGGGNGNGATNGGSGNKP